MILFKKYEEKFFLHFAIMCLLILQFSRKRREDLDDPTIYPLINQLNGYIERIYTAGVFDRVERQFVSFWAKVIQSEWQILNFLWSTDIIPVCERPERILFLSLALFFSLSPFKRMYVCMSFTSRGGLLRHEILNNKFDAPAWLDCCLILRILVYTKWNIELQTSP